jgi:hypothetical protein
MSFMQIYSDSLPDYPADCTPLRDFAFRALPNLRTALSWMSSSFYASAADVWVIVSIVLFILVSLFQKRPQLIFRRFMWIMSFIFLLRALIVPATRYPGLPEYADRYRPSNWLAGALLIIAGVHQTSTDMLFSGHTANWIITACMVARYTRYGVGSILFWIFNVAGIFILLALQEHYLTDVLTAVVIASLTFTLYHVAFDSKYLRFWHPGLKLEFDDKKKSKTFYARYYAWARWLDGE